MRAAHAATLAGGYLLALILSAMCAVSHADLYEGERFKIDGDIQLKLVTLDELPVDAGVKIPETTYSDVVTSLWTTWQQSENIRYKLWLKTEFLQLRYQP